MRREEQVTVQGPVKKLQPDGMSHKGQAASGLANECHHVWLGSGVQAIVGENLDPDTPAEQLRNLQGSRQPCSVPLAPTPGRGTGEPPQ